MKNLILSFLLIPLFSLQLASDPVNPITTDQPYRGSTQLMIQNEIGALDALIEVTEQNLNNQKQLRTQIADYQKIQSAYLSDTENRELLFRVAKSANRIYSQIEESHLGHAFNPEFLKELKIFASVAKKRGIPKA